MEGKVLTPKEIQEVRERAEKATPGPWVRDYASTLGHIKSIHPYGEARTPTVAKYNILPDDLMPDDEKGNNADFIAHARQDIPNLLATLSDHDSRLKALVEAARKLQDRLDWHFGTTDEYARQQLDWKEQEELRTALEPFKEGS